jgi:MtN3 and saliva related transmembrane protein
MIELLGWGSSTILLVTLVRQVYTQWRTHATAGLSKWLFIGQCSASAGYIVYSFMLHNWVYLSSNIAILITAIVGEGLYLRNRRRAAHRTAGINSSVEATPS